MLHLPSYIVKIPRSSSFLILNFFLKVAQVVLLLAEKKKHLFTIQLFLWQHRTNSTHAHILLSHP